MFEKFSSVGDQRILVIGDIILDKYIYGQSTRISPEAPVPIVLSDRESYVLGGAANVAANLTSLGANAYLMGCVGNDKNGDRIVELSKMTLIDTSGIFRSNKITTTKTRIVSKGQQMLRIDEEDVGDITIYEEDLLYKMITNSIQKNEITGIIMQDYNKGLLTASLIKKIINISKTYQIPFFVDPKFKNFWEYRDAILFKPNLSEIKKANNSNEYKSLDEMLLLTSKKLNCTILMCTLAEDGIAYVEEEKIVYAPTQKIDVVDVSGAGDSSLSIIVLAYLLGYDTTCISTLANLCGKVVCMKSGVSTITIQELKEAYHVDHVDIVH